MERAEFEREFESQLDCDGVTIDVNNIMIFADAYEIDDTDLVHFRLANNEVAQCDLADIKRVFE